LLIPQGRRHLLQRIALNTTTSYKALEQHWQDDLLQLHNDYYHHRQVGLRCMQLYLCCASNEAALPSIGLDCPRIAALIHCCRTRCGGSSRTARCQR
jgi:hypothetical protein